MPGVPSLKVTLVRPVDLVIKRGRHNAPAVRLGDHPTRVVVREARQAVFRLLVADDPPQAIHLLPAGLSPLDNGRETVPYVVTGLLIQVIRVPLGTVLGHRRRGEIGRRVLPDFPQVPFDIVGLDPPDPLKRGQSFKIQKKRGTRVDESATAAEQSLSP